MIEKIQSFLKSTQIIIPNDKVIAAVSGGLDSVVMLQCLYKLHNRFPFSLEVVHVNHGIRGDDADEDEKFVMEMCRHLDLQFYSEKLSGFDLETSEDQLRNARYTIFDDILKKNSGAKIATAHTLDDQLETFLMRLSKGSKLNGLCGIPVKRDNFVRPVIFLKKKELLEFALNNHIQFREDFTNRDESKTRNKIRNRIIPELINVFGDSFFEGFQTSLNDLTEVNKYLKAQIEDLLKKISELTSDGLLLKTDAYLSLNYKLRHLILEACVSGYYPLNFGIPSGYFQEFESFVSMASTGAIFRFRNNLRAIKFRKELLFTNQVETYPEKLELYPGDVVYTGNYAIKITEIDQQNVKYDKDNTIELICGDDIKWPLQVRRWENGDFFYPLGSGKRQKLSDFFINQKIETIKKSQIPIIVDGDKIVWIAGLRIDHRYQIKKSCKKIFKMELRSKTES